MLPTCVTLEGWNGHLWNDTKQPFWAMRQNGGRVPFLQLPALSPLHSSQCGEKRIERAQGATFTSQACSVTIPATSSISLAMG